MDERTHYLLIGGGPASAFAAQAIRERDRERPIILVAGESHPPYEKPPLSKRFLTDDEAVGEDAHVKDVSFYAENHVEIRAGVRAAKIDRANRIVTLANGDTIAYEKLLLATGSRPRHVDIPGANLPGVFYLRTLDDSEAIRTAMQHSRRAVLVGGGYIGMEVASGCAQRDIETTVVEAGSHPWSRFASPDLGGFIATSFEQRGVRVLPGRKIVAFEGDGVLAAATTDDGTRIDADFAVVGVGALLNVDMAIAAGLEADAQTGVRVDRFLQTSDSTIWAAGDIANFEDAAMGERWHLEHHLNAKWQGRAAGANMAGEHAPYDKVPYFFSDLLDLHMILRGNVNGAAATRVLGDLNGGEFIELYSGSNDRLRMGVAISHVEANLDPISDRLEGLIRAGAAVSGIGEHDLGIPGTRRAA